MRRRAATDEQEPRRAPTSTVLTREFGALELWYVTVRVSGDAARAGAERLGRLSNHFQAGEAVRERAGRAVLEDYRAFERQVGLDPGVPRTRTESAALAAILAGRLVSTGPVPDALLGVLVTTGVPVWALDAARVAGDLELRTASAGETLGRGRRAEGVPAGTIVVADEQSPLALAFADPPARHDGARAREVVLYALGVPGVSQLEVGEAVWTAARFLRGN